jgi:hypothetical protein
MSDETVSLRRWSPGFAPVSRSEIVVWFSGARDLLMGGRILGPDFANIGSEPKFSPSVRPKGLAQDATTMSSLGGSDVTSAVTHSNHRSYRRPCRYRLVYRTN